MQITFLTNYQFSIQSTPIVDFYMKFSSNMSCLIKDSFIFFIYWHQLIVAFPFFYVQTLDTCCHKFVITSMVISEKSTVYFWNFEMLCTFCSWVSSFTIIHFKILFHVKFYNCSFINFCIQMISKWHLNLAWASCTIIKLSICQHRILFYSTSRSELESSNGHLNPTLIYLFIYAFA